MGEIDLTEEQYEKTEEGNSLTQCINFDDYHDL